MDVGKLGRTWLNKFRATFCANATASVGATLLASTMAVDVEGAAFELTSASLSAPSAATCASTISEGSQRIPSVALRCVPVDAKPAEDWDEATWFPRSRKMADGLFHQKSSVELSTWTKWLNYLVLDSLWTEVSARAEGRGREDPYAPINCQPFP